MPLAELTLRYETTALPLSVSRFLREADRRIERFQSTGRVPGFVPSDYPSAYLFLRGLAESAVAPGGRLCEWGSGFGVVACLAAMIGFDACGIEIEEELVDEARRLAEDFELSVPFVRGSFIPAGGEVCLGAGREFAWLSAVGEDTSDELGLSPDEHDVIFSYPWPDEESLIPELFERYAAPGAVLVTHHGGDAFRLRRRSKRRGR